MTATKRVTADELAQGYWLLRGVDFRRYEFEVVERHDDGSVTVVDPDPQPAATVTETATTELREDQPAPTGPGHEIRYVRGPLNRRYRCTQCPWEGADRSLHSIR